MTEENIFSSNNMNSPAQNDFLQGEERELRHIGEIVELQEDTQSVLAEQQAASETRPQLNAADFLAAAQKSQIAAYGAQKSGDKALQMAQKLLELYIAEKQACEEQHIGEDFLRKELIAVRDSIHTLNSSLAAEKVGVQLSEEALKKCTLEFDALQRDCDGAQLEAQRLEQLALQNEAALGELLQKQQELSARIRQAEDKLKSSRTAAMAAASLLADCNEKKQAAAELLQQAESFDKETRDKYRSIQLEFSQARQNAAGILTQLRCINAELPQDMEELLQLCEADEAGSAPGAQKKSFFGRRKNKA